MGMLGPDVCLVVCRYEQFTADNAVFSLPPARILILFSGGLDSTVLAALAHHALPENEPIDLINVCFDRGASPDRASSLDALEELSEVAPNRDWRLLLVNATLVDVDAIRQRLSLLPTPCKPCLIKKCLAGSAIPLFSWLHPMLARDSLVSFQLGHQSILGCKTA
jgi:hypothetical protein